MTATPWGLDRDDMDQWHGPSVPSGRSNRCGPGDILQGSMNEAPTTPSARVALPIEGMTCASCVNRIERFLRKTPGVTDATVNLATEVATIHYLPETAGRSELVAAIEAAGYELKPERAGGESAAARSLREAAEADAADRARYAA